VIDLESVCSWGDVVEVQETTRIHESNLTKTGGTVEAPYTTPGAAAADIPRTLNA